MSGRGFAIGGEPSRVMASPEDVERLKVSGYRDEQIGNETHRIPDVSRKSLALLRFGQLPAVSGHDSRFGTFVQPGTDEWREYFSTRKVVETTDVSGARRVEVTSNIHDKLHPEQIIHQPITEINLMEAMDDKPDYTPVPGRERRPRRYQLVDLLTDTYIMDKFAFPENLMNSIKFMAVSDPDQAAAKAQAYMRNRPGSERVTVVAGKYARSRQWACGSVKAHASRFPATIAASDAIVIGSKVSIFGPGESTDKRWSVYGPAKYMLELMDVFKMVASAGTAPVMFSLGTELTVLDIDIHNGDEFESPTVELHSGSQEHLPMQSSPIVGEFLSAEGRMQLEMYKQNVDLVEVGGVPVASAVRISSRHVLVNSHVLAEDMKVGGQPAVPVRMLSKDLWLLRSSVRYDVAWPLRDPEIGESVAVCYRRGSELQLSSPITVRSCDGHSIIMSKASDLRQGMSGGAIVALSDFSLLGLYDGVGATAALGLVFSQESFTDVCTMDRVTVADREEAMEGENSLYTRMKDKGLAKYLQIATSSIRPMYCGLEHVGMAYAAGDRLVTTCDPDMGPLSVGKSGVPRVYEDMGKGQFYTLEHVGRGPSIVRKPSYGEEVFILGKDEEGPYFSSRKSRVIHVGLSAKTFAISDVTQDGALPFVGGLVVAVTDAAVLGQYVRQSVTEMFGEHGYCVGMHSSVSIQTSRLESDVVTIEKMFPMLHPTVWDPHLLEEVLTHSSVQFYSDLSPFNSGMLPLAYIGAAAFRVAVGVHLRETGVPTNRWQVGIQARMSTSALAAKAEEVGLASMIRTGAGVSLASGGKPHADVLEALAGAVYLCETSETFSEFVQFLDLLTIE